jgi:acetyl/propionyl-CoA carboxylase alpha subunit
LAENAGFASRCVEAGLVFVGPSPDAIATMGDKIEAKRIAIGAGVECVPGYHGDDQSDEGLLREAEKIGMPLLIKASAGGGGRGMRRVDELNTVVENLSLARQEAQAAFGDPKLLLERYVESPRHIEVQIMADQHGNVRHLFERDCSVQRNYQKIIEEAPAPSLPSELRQQILESAVKLAVTIGYDSVGTIEFIVDAATGHAFFLEMNTRLQVEHPVTEMITGIDLVEWQLRIAGGDVLSLAQDDIVCKGWAMEARVAAENSAENYRAQTGTITSYAEPSMEGLRIDSGVQQGSRVTPYYDSLLAKVIAMSVDRETTIQKLDAGLSRFRIAGVGVNTRYLRDVLHLDDFQAGRHLTSCLREGFPDGWSSSPITNTDVAVAALAYHLEREGSGSQSPWSTLGGWRVGERSGRRGAAVYYIRTGDQTFGETTVIGRGGTFTIERDGKAVLQVREATWRAGRLTYTEQTLRQSIDVSVDGVHVTCHCAAGDPVFDVLSSKNVSLGEIVKPVATGNSVIAPTPGLIAEVMVSNGDTVEIGQPVFVMEAMKLFQQLCAPIGGVVEAINAQPGDTVNGGDRLAVIASADPQDEDQGFPND